MTTSRLELSVYWVGGAAGRLVIHRAVEPTGRPADDIVQMWATDRCHETDVVTGVDLGPAVGALTRGRVVERPVRITPSIVARRIVSAGEIDALLADLVDTAGVQLLYRMTGTADDSTGDDRRPALTALDITYYERDPLSAQLFSTLDPGTAGMRRADRPPGRSAEHRRARGDAHSRGPGRRDHPGAAGLDDDPEQRLRDALDRLRLRDCRGVQVGEHNVQINRFTAESAPGETLDFAGVIDRPGVRDRLARLARDPGDDTLRADVVEALGPGWWSADRICLTVPRRTPVGWLEGLLMFDVRGLQVGNEATQENLFVYALPPLPSAGKLLEARPELAKALIDAVCPPPDQGFFAADVHSRFDREFRQSLDAVDVNWDGIGTPRVFEFPGPGRMLRLDSVDGATIGPHGRQRHHRSEHVHATPEFGGREMHYTSIEDLTDFLDVDTRPHRPGHLDDDRISTREHVEGIGRIDGGRGGR
ncbi:hypothetical protein [Cryptosporangium arvum]|uniref:hypothetical protein n=1 Tax=Cryptosporangium arvum TaxID=80871 RepID=UPI0004AD9099|nr:hypothetical protein [Cryptosporangium arvum]